MSLSIGLFLLVSVAKDWLRVESLVLGVGDLSDPNEEVLKSRLSSIAFKYLSILVCDLSSLNFDLVFEECSVLFETGFLFTDCENLSENFSICSPLDFSGSSYLRVTITVAKFQALGGIFIDHSDVEVSLFEVFMNTS